MSELINIRDDRRSIRWKLLTTASALALTAYVSSANVARAEDSERPMLWIDLGGQMEQMHGLATPFTAPFMTALSPTPAPYRDNIFIKGQEPPRFAFGMDGKITFQPEDSDWLFSVGIRYGRSHANRHIHHQTALPTVVITTASGYALHTRPATNAVADAATPFEERHTIADFEVGKDVGLGLLGREGSSSINAGIRFAQFRTYSSFDAKAIPKADTDIFYISKYSYYGVIRFPQLAPNFHQYTMKAHAARSFSGVGPTLSWNASAVLAGNSQDSEITLDWGVNAALLFGRQKAKTDHTTGGYHNFSTQSGKYVYAHHVVTSHTGHSTRSRNVTVPNVGGFAGISLKWPNAKLSIGYRADVFLNAMDTGIDTTTKSNLTFNGPYASISVGLGD